jgi:hypothetical protein
VLLDVIIGDRIMRVFCKCPPLSNPHAALRVALFYEGEGAHSLRDALKIG